MQMMWPRLFPFRTCLAMQHCAHALRVQVSGMEDTHGSPQQARCQPWVTLLLAVVSVGVTARLHAQVRAAQQGHQRGHRSHTAGACAALRLTVHCRQKLHSCRQRCHNCSRQNMPGPGREYARRGSWPYWLADAHVGPVQCCPQTLWAMLGRPPGSRRSVWPLRRLPARPGPPRQAAPPAGAGRRFAGPGRR